MAIKKVAPYTDLLIVKVAIKYSYAWIIEKFIPKMIVINKPLIVCLNVLLIKLWWDQVIDRPEEISKIVFKSGILKGLNGVMFVGGQDSPNWIVGDNLEWKYLQKNEIKKNTSEVIKRIIPHFNPCITFFVWRPWNVLSRVTSRHQVNIVNKIIIKPVSDIENPILQNDDVIPINIVITPSDLVKGQGL